MGLALVAGCAAGSPPSPLTGVVIPVRDTAPSKPYRPRAAPPASEPPKPYHVPEVVWGELANGLKVATLPDKASTLAQVRVVIGGGHAADGERPGLAALTAQLLEDGGTGGMSGRNRRTRVEPLGAELSIETSFDAITLGLAAARDHLAEALDRLGAVVQRPQLSPVELEKLKAREAARLAGLARTEGAWGAKVMLYRDLFSLPSEHHPYATWSATPAEIQQLTVADCRAFHRRFFVPRNTFVVVAGDITPEAAQILVQRAFGAFRGGEPPAISFTDPLPSAARKITLVDLPRSSESDVFVGALGPPPSDRSFAAFTLAAQILDAGLHEEQSPAYDTASSVTELAHGPSVLLAHAGTETATTGLALARLLDHLDRLATTVSSAEELEAAQHRLAGSLAVRLGALGQVADEIARLHALGLPDEHDDGYRRELGESTPPLALKAASDHLRSGHEVIVVAGDATLIGRMLSHFGEVKVVDPTRDFARERTLPMDASAPLELPRQETP
jgi:zinc protease